MLVRIVKLTFKNENIASFEQIFDANKAAIEHFEGCEKLELYQDRHDKSLFFTYSHWTHETALENYRNSDFFKEVWAKTKILFADKPEAWSLHRIAEVK